MAGSVRAADCWLTDFAPQQFGTLQRHSQEHHGLLASL